MLKKLLAYVGEYKKVSLLSPLFIAVEVMMEILIPFLMFLGRNRLFQSGQNDSNHYTSTF